MTSIYKRKLKNGKGFHWRAVVRINGFKTISKTYDRKQEAEDWARDTEAAIKNGTYKFNAHRKKHTLSQLIQLLSQDDERSKQS